MRYGELWVLLFIISFLHLSCEKEETKPIITEKNANGKNNQIDKLPESKFYSRAPELSEFPSTLFLEEKFDDISDWSISIDTVEQYPDINIPFSKSGDLNYNINQAITIDGILNLYAYMSRKKDPNGWDVKHPYYRPYSYECSAKFQLNNLPNSNMYLIELDLLKFKGYSSYSESGGMGSGSFSYGSEGGTQIKVNINNKTYLYAYKCSVPNEKSRLSLIFVSNDIPGETPTHPVAFVDSQFISPCLSQFSGSNEDYIEFSLIPYSSSSISIGNVSYRYHGPTSMSIDNLRISTVNE